MKSSISSFKTTLLVSLLGLANLEAQQIITGQFTPDSWDIEAQESEFTQFKGNTCLYLQHGEAHLKGSEFKTGIIDYDILFEPGRKFAGVQFRIQDPGNYEEFYMRAHQSGNPDATQYTPVFNGTAGWQLYHGDGHSTAFNYDFGEWIHVRLVVDENCMDVFINDMSQPVLYVNDLKRAPEEGMIGFWSFLGGAWYANLTYQAMDNPQLISEAKDLPPPPPGTILEWQVSSAFNVEELIPVIHLQEFSLLDGLQWQTLPVEYTGTVNLARISPVTGTTNTVLVKKTIVSDREQVKRLDFGYSDLAILYVNDQIVYSGQRSFRSRDYRYLGTIGYFDSVYLDLKKGKNEVVFAVYETSGGWGIKAKLEDLEGIDP